MKQNITRKSGNYHIRVGWDDVLVSFPVAVIKYLDKSTLKERGFVWLMIQGYSPSLWERQNGENLRQLVTP